MSITQLADNFMTSPQIAVSDVAQIKAMGFDGIVCNRPDGEEPNQPRFADIKQEADRLGVDIAFIPMSGPQLTMPMVEQFNQFMSDHKRVLGYCRTGNRASIIWKAAQSVIHN